MTPEFNHIDKKIERALATFYDHARKRNSFVEAKQAEGLSKQEAETAWDNDLDSLRATLAAAYRELKDHMYPRKG